nr:hypothetical protein SHINE37_100127 [Rhizobiaceae bacterium]
MGEASPVFPGEWPLTFPRTERGGRQPALRRRSDGSRGRDGEKTEGSAAGGKPFICRRDKRLCRACPLIRTTGAVMGRKQRCGPASGLSAGGVATDWTSDRYRHRRRRPQAGSVLRIERVRPGRAVAQLAFLRVADANPAATLRSDRDDSLKEKSNGDGANPHPLYRDRQVAPWRTPLGRPFRAGLFLPGQGHGETGVAGLAC